MMMSFVYVLAAVWFVRIVVHIVALAHLWRVKEYRIDRMLIHLKTPQGKRIYMPQVKRPPVSPKSILFIVLMAGAALFVYAASGFGNLLTLFVFDALSVPLSFVVVMVLNVPVRFYHAIVIRSAVGKLRAHKSMKVIGITGSYGKTSTKEYAAAVISDSRKVIKTDASKNSPIGIAETIHRLLTPADEVFVVEMGAYKQGEISVMCRMVMPQIAVITAINEQHQDLFGSIDSTMQAKYELIKGLSGDRIAICNADDVRVVQMGKRAQSEGVRVWWIGTGTAIPSGERLFRASAIKSTGNNLSFVCSDGNERLSVSAPLCGKHQVTNVLAAIAAAVAVGIDFFSAVSASKKIQPVAHTLNAITKNGAVYIDDTFNNNPDAAIAALHVLQKQKGKKILVFQPMIELGTFAEAKHRQVGETAGHVCDEIILTNKNWSDAFKNGVATVSSRIPVSVMDPKNAADRIASMIQPGDAVLFKGKEAAHVLRVLAKSR